MMKRRKASLKTIRNENVSERVVIIDANEAAMCPVIKDLISHRFKVDIQPLKSADYVLSKQGKMKGSIGIERKTISDLTSSIMDGRLFHQIITLCDTYEYPVLLIEGSLYPFATNSTLMGTYMTLVYSYKKLRIAHSRDMKGSAAFIKRSAIYLGPTGRVPPPVMEKKDKPRDIKLAMLQVIKGVGAKVADRLLRQVPDLFYSYKDEEKLIKKISSVKGISEEKAKQIAKIFGRIE